MAPSIPTHRPLLTPTRVATLIAAAACVSTLYLALGGMAQAAEAHDAALSARVCPADAQHASR